MFRSYHKENTASYVPVNLTCGKGVVDEPPAGFFFWEFVMKRGVSPEMVIEQKIGNSIQLYHFSYVTNNVSVHFNVCLKWPIICCILF